MFHSCKTHKIRTTRVIKLVFPTHHFKNTKKPYVYHVWLFVLLYDFLLLTAPVTAANPRNTS